MTALPTRLPAGLRPRGLTWSVLTTHRAALRVWAICVVLALAVLLGLHLFGQELREVLVHCGTSYSRPCERGVMEDLGTYRGVTGLVRNSVAYLAVVVAAFAGAALTGRETESGTAALGWTQSVTPARWLATKLALPAIILVSGMLVLALTFRWVRDAGGGRLAEPWSLRETFLVTGPTGTAYVLLAVAAGALVGLLVRRTLAALAVSTTAVVGAVLLGAKFWTDLWPKVTSVGTWSLPEGARRSMFLDGGGITASGEKFGFDRCFTGDLPNDLKQCLEKLDAQPYVTYHPASHYWPLQLVETGVVLTCTAALTAAAFWLLRRRVP
jgi:hypothetical protein